MSDTAFSEVSAIQDSWELWKDIHLNTGAAQSTLQDIKLAESAGGYTYKENPLSHISQSVTRNRSIYWRHNDNVLELIEVSLDTNLTGNYIRIHFQNTPVLEGITVHETPNKIIILVATVSSVHKLVFTHPIKLGFSSSSPQFSVPSIFCDVTTSSLWDTSSIHLLNHAGSGFPLPHTSTTHLMENNDAIFVLANNSGMLLVICMPHGGGNVISFEMKQSSVMSRLWNGIVPSSIRGSQEGEDMALSLECYDAGNDCLIFALCKDLRLRIWSLQKRECLCSFLVLDCCRDVNGGGNSWILSGHHPCLRKFVSSDKRVFVAVYISLPELSQFCIFQTVISGGQYQLIPVSSFCAPEFNMVDFRITENQFWTLWLNTNSEPVILMKNLHIESGRISSSAWINTALNPTSQEIAPTIGQLDPREVYTQEIFFPGRFSTTTINKAISIYCRSADSSIRGNLTTKPEQLREKVTMAVENEILSKANENELADDDYLELQLECWERFFSYCVQYNEVGIKVLGLVADFESGVVSLIRKNSISVLRPCDPLECTVLSDYMNASPETWMKNVSFAFGSIQFADSSISRSILALLKCVNIIRECTSETMLAIFDDELYQLHSAEALALDATNELIHEYNQDQLEEPLFSKMENELKGAQHILEAFDALLQALDLRKWPGEEMDCGDDDSAAKNSFNTLFNGHIGTELICRSIQQMVKLRYGFCRDLLFLEHVIISIGDKCDLSMEKVEEIRSRIISMTSTYTQGYFVMQWITQTPSARIKPNTLEKALRELYIIEVPEPKLYYLSSHGGVTMKTILQLFAQEQGSVLAHRLLNDVNLKSESVTNVGYQLITLSSFLCHFIWPISINMVFPEFLLSYSQYIPLQQYIRLLEPWCEWNNYSRLFLMANTHLAMGQHLKAVDLFCKASTGIIRENYLATKIWKKAASEDTTNSALLQYYLKVIQLFSYFNLPDSIIRLAFTAVGVAPENDPNLATFWSLIFKYHLDMDHCEDSYTAMTNNPDSTRRRDCLRQLLVVMFERGHLKQLIQFPFIDMTDDVILILESKARSTDLTSHKYYEFLYSFHMKCTNFRRAASAMYEYGIRLSQEVIGLASLSQQASCLLTTLNCLHLVNPKYSWIVKPVPTPNDIEDKFNSMGLSPKRGLEGEAIERTEASKRSVEVLEMKDIRREYDLIHARLLLLKKDTRPTNMAASIISAADTVTLLVSEGLYEQAVNLCEAYKMKFHPVFDGLASRLANARNIDTVNQNDWNRDEDSFVVEDRSELELQTLLGGYLKQFDLKGQSTYHRTVAEKLFAIKLNIPTWLKNSYKERNWPELIALFIKYNLIEEANDLVIELIDNVVTGARKCSNVKSLRLWLPYTLIDCILAILEERCQESEYHKMYISLQDKLKYYFNLAEKIASDIKKAQ